MKKILAVLLMAILTMTVKAEELPTEVQEAIIEAERTEVTEEEFEMLAHLVKAEAGNQELLGKQLVVDVVLNRVRSEKFPNTIESVIYASGQFACSDYFMSKQPTQEDYKAVEMELKCRTDKEVIYFRTGKYGSAIPLYKQGDHYFSK